MRRLALLVTLVCGTAFADTVIVVDRDRTRTAPNLLLVNPGDLFNGVLSLEYERALGPHFGLTGGFSVATFDGPFNLGQPAYTTFGPEFGARIHLIEDAPGGLWLGPTLSGSYVISRAGGSVYRSWSWGLGAAVGYNFIIAHRFAVQVGVGGGFTDYGDALVWAPRLRLGLGGVF
jgi:hypothetical protein